MIKFYPVKFEAYEDQSIVFSVEAQDDVCACIDIEGAVSRDSWVEISAAIAECLAQMFPKEDA